MFTLINECWKNTSGRNHWIIADYQFEKLPVLEVDGVQVSQTLAIIRYIARENGNVLLLLHNDSSYWLLLVVQQEFRIGSETQKKSESKYRADYESSTSPLTLGKFQRLKCMFKEKKLGERVGLLIGTLANFLSIWDLSMFAQAWLTMSHWSLTRQFESAFEFLIFNLWRRT